jgi:WD40 repeat protein
MTFQSERDQALSIGEAVYRVSEQPSAPGVPYSKQGDTSTVYKLTAPDGEPNALKIFDMGFQIPDVARVSTLLMAFAGLPGLRVSNRVVLTPGQHAELLHAYPRLSYAILMPWVQGPTWEEVLIDKHPLSMEQSLSIARALVETLTALEELGAAHGDLSSANLLLPGLADSSEVSGLYPVELVDLDKFIAPGLQPIHIKPPDPPIYKHRSDPQGAYSPAADRFPGALLLAEMLGWYDERVREAAWGESYFDPGELQMQSHRYEVLIAALRRIPGGQLGKLLDRAWFSETLLDCPTFSEWLAGIPSLIPIVLPAITSSVGVSSTVLSGVQPAISVADEERLADQLELEGIFRDGVAAYTGKDWAKARELLGEVVRREPGYAQDGKKASKLLARSERQLRPRRRPGLLVPLLASFLACIFLLALAIVPDGAPLHASVFGATKAQAGLVITASGVAKIAELAHFGKGWIYKVRFSPDGRSLAVGSSVGVYLYDAESLALVRTLVPQQGDEQHGTGAVDMVAWSPDGRTLADGATNGTVRLWRVTDGAMLHTLAGHTKRVGDLTFAPDGLTLASASYDGTVRLWRVSDGALVRTLQVSGGEVPAAVFSPNGRVLATASANGTIVLWDPSSGATLRALSGHDNAVMSLSFAPDGRTLASGSEDQTVRVWRVSDGSLLQTLRGHAGWVAAVVYSPDGRLIASAGEDGPVRLWDSATGTVRQTLSGHRGQVLSLAFSPDGSTLVSASWDSTIRRWRIATTAKDTPALTGLDGFTGEVWSMAVSPDGRTIAVGDDWNVRLLSPGNGDLLRALPGSGRAVHAVAFDATGKTLASGGVDNQVRLWEMPRGESRQVFSGHTGDIKALAFSPDSSTLASASTDNTVRLWKVAKGGIQRVLAGHKAAVISLAFSPDGQTLAAGDESGAVRLWRASDGLTLAILDSARGGASSLAFSADGKLLAASTWEGGIRLLERGSTGWNKPQTRSLNTLSEHPRRVTFSPDGQLLVVGNQNWTISILSVPDGRLLRTLDGHTDLVTEVAFAPDGRSFFSASADGTIRLWGIPPGNGEKH